MGCGDNLGFIINRVRLEYMDFLNKQRENGFKARVWELLW